MKLYLLLLFLLILGCVSTKETQQVKFRYSVLGNHKVFRVNLPRYAKIIKITAGGEGEEHRYFYLDSSIVYITSLNGAATLNEILIDKSVDDYNRKFKSDTASFAGVDGNGLYWKEIRLHGIIFGYLKVPSSKKMQFDKSLSSAK